MNERHLRALVRADARRFRAQILRLLGMSGVLAIVHRTGILRQDVAVILLLAMALACVLTPALVSVRDRLDGTMEFLSGLPLSSATFGASRLVTIGWTSALGALQVGLVVAWTASTWWHQPAAPGLFAASLVLLWLALVGFASLVGGSLLRFDLQALQGPGPVLFLLGFLVVGHLIPWSPDPVALLERLLASPRAPAVVAAVFTGACLAAVAAGFWLLAEGHRRHVPVADRITW